MELPRSGTYLVFPWHRCVFAWLGSRATPVDDRAMHIELGTLMIGSALVASLVLVLDRGNRIIPVVAVVAAGLAAAIHFGVLSLAVAKFRIDVVLPALFVIAGGVCALDVQGQHHRGDRFVRGWRDDAARGTAFDRLMQPATVVRQLHRYDEPRQRREPRYG
jgi:hypothetical protein